MHNTIIIAALLACAPHAFAQNAQTPSTEKGAQGAAPAPMVLSPSLQKPPAAPASTTAGYRSVFTDYRPYADPQPASWRELNQRAGALGGHRGQIRQEAPTETGAPAARDSAPAPHRH